MAKLRLKEPITVIAYGMSITCGNNTSGFAGDENNFKIVAPYMHSYVDILGDALRKRFGCEVTLFNASCGGKTAAWADQNVENLVIPNNPDLVLLDHGMNDIWNANDTTLFNQSIISTISKIKKKCPNAEFILVNNMLPGTTTGSAGAYGRTLMKKLRDYEQKLEDVGVVNFPMTQMSDSIYNRKGETQCMANSLHPNDYLVRWYAQGLINLFGEATVGINQVSVEDNFLSISPNPVNQGIMTIKLADVNDEQSVTISILDAKGVMVAYFRQSTPSKDYDISSLSLNRGVYFVKAQKGNKVSTQKLIVG
jgi:lysophospholipase L1-like esterase